MSSRTGNDRSFFIQRIATPTGPMLLLTDAQERVRALDWEDHEERMQRRLARHGGADADAAWVEPSSGRASKARRAVQAYFGGELSALEALDVHTGGTQFQRDVWAALRAIPVGETTSYGQLATTIGRPRAVRAVGLANGANPIALVVPCHRVIGADASLTGYGGGIERKRWLLEHEGVYLEAPRARRPRTNGQAAFAYV
jgi:methylated-DNA-[protein]-cysteine S-methyltransferase